MKITELKKGQLFKLGNQRKFRRFFSCEIINNLNIKNKLIVCYDDCKQMVVDPSTEVITREGVNGYASLYSVDIDYKREININGFQTNIAPFMKGNITLDYFYCIQNKSGEYVGIDIRDTVGFPDINADDMM